MSSAPTGLVRAASDALAPQELPKVFEQASAYAPEFVLAGRLGACRHDSGLLVAGKLVASRLRQQPSLNLTMRAAVHKLQQAFRARNAQQQRPGSACVRLGLAARRSCCRAVLLAWREMLHLSVAYFLV